MYVGASTRSIPACHANSVTSSQWGSGMRAYDIRSESTINNQVSAWVPPQPTHSRDWIVTESSTWVWISVLNFVRQFVKRLWGKAGSGHAVCSHIHSRNFCASEELILATHRDLVALFAWQAMSDCVDHLYPTLNWHTQLKQIGSRGGICLLQGKNESYYYYYSC